MTSANAKSRMHKVFLAVFAMIAVVVQFLHSMFGILAESAETSPDDATSNAARGGVLNYRTGKLDDGTDAAGWYEKD